MTSSRTRILSASVWSSFDVGLRFGIQFVVSIILARLLSPTDFGIYALTLVFISLSNVLVDGGFSTALVQRPQITREEETAVFWYNLIVALLLTGAIVGMAPFVARLFGHPVLESLLYATAAVIPINAMTSVPAAMLQRHLRFDLVAKSGLTASICSGLMAVVVAMNGIGIWTFVYQAITYAVINTVLLWLLSGWRPMRRPHLTAARPLIRFGFFLTLAGILEVAYTQGAALVIGKFYGPRDLGFYNRGQNLQNLPTNVLTAVITRISLPVLSSKSDDEAALKRGLKFAQGAIMLVNLPLMGALVAMPDLIVETLYGPKWLPAAPILRILAIGGALFPLHAVNLQLILAKGRSGLYLKTEIIKKIIGIAFVAFGSFYGIIGLAVAQAVFIYIAFFINASVSGRLSGYTPLTQLRDLVGTATLTVAMVVLIMLVRPMLGFGSVIDLILLSMTGGVFFGAIALILRIGATDAVIALMPMHRLRRSTSRQV